MMSNNLPGFYALHLYLPVSTFSRQWRRYRAKAFGKKSRRLQQVKLPQLDWRHCVKPALPALVELRKSNGNVRVSELAILSLFASACEDGSNLFEIGTFDGRTSINLAHASPRNCKVITLDLPPETAPRFDLASGERHMVDKPVSGARIAGFKKSNPEQAGKIIQLLGDSATFDFSPYYGSCSFVFIDGSHAYDYVMSDSQEALKMLKPGGVILWHDYGIWEDVTSALEELALQKDLAIANIKGTSLAFLRQTGSAASA